jgi:hypothetical protein
MQTSYLKDNGLSSTDLQHCAVIQKIMNSSPVLLNVASLALLATSTFAAPLDLIGTVPLKRATTAVGPRQAV